ncbi:MAG: CPBP family intramembrane glutamic endopeptidase [Candidatus Heimdallarchaeota archaeon]
MFSGRDYAEKYGYRRSGLMKSAIIGMVLTLPLFILGCEIAAGPAPPLLAWYGFIVLEETYFRGLWQRAGTHLAGSLGAVFIPAALFGIYHLPLGFTPIQALGVVLFGLLLGWLRKSTDNLFGPILLHSALATGMWFSSL